ncbi:MAG TPA: protein kinase [Gemmatimonadaceae bacterium]|nr:protein kinase [Gemmatimonadaceae bacterium]
MNDRWEQVVQIFEEAVKQPATERERFVAVATAGDVELREEVLDLLRADASAHRLFDMTPAQLAHGVQPHEPQSLAGRSIGVYTLTREVGRGGMATVYEGEDTKHHRAVALKLLDAAASSALGSERFRREIDVVARMQHPNILPLYDSGEADGLLYFVMPFVSGGTLRERIARDGPLPLADVRRITSQVAAALDYAHRRGVIHRDIKPANVLLNEDHVTIADFGIAQSPGSDSGDRLTAAGIFVGTPGYMSPEHATAGAELDARSDVYSLACVAFEMLTGQPPFQAPTTSALLAKHLSHPVPSARAARPDLPAAVDDVMQRGLAKDRAERFATACELRDALDAALAGQRPARRHSLGRRWVAAACAALGLALLVVGAYLTRGSRDTPSIAVLPFANMSGDSANEYFSDGLTEEITGALAQLGRVRVTPRTTAFAYKGRAGDIRNIGNELGVSRILEGSVRRDGDRVLFLATLYDAESGDRLWHNRYERSWGAILTLQNEIAGTVAEQLRVRLLPADSTRLVGRHSVSADAYESYMKGRYFFGPRTASSLQQALGHFKRAIEIDSTYARAYAGLADTYSILAWTGAGAPRELFGLADEAARRALALDSTMAEAYVSLGIINTFHNWDWQAADRAFTRAIALDSTSALAWFFNAWNLMALGRSEELLAALQRSRSLDPVSLMTNVRFGQVLLWMDRVAEGEAVLRATLELDESHPVARLQLARALSMQGRHAEAIAMLPPDSIRFGSFESGIAGFVYARAGDRAKALAAARALESRPNVPNEGVAVIYAGLGEKDAALTWLERAYEARGIGLHFLAAEPLYDALRREPRYKRLVERLALADARAARPEGSR